MSGTLVRGVAIGAILFISLADVALAHPLAPALLELTETAPGVVSVRWKTSLWKQSGTELEPRLPATCTALTPPQVRVDDVSATTTWSVDCGPAGLVGAIVGVRGADESQTDTLLRIGLADGRSLQAILRTGQATYTIPERAARGGIMRQYAGLGVHHILGGFDHLLFVFGLLLLVSGPRALAKTVTAFTAGHSVTLSLAALGYTALPSGPIEVLIALTILALAVELAQPRPSLLRRRPWAMAFLFGLLHGLGFAGALTEIGLPAGEIPAALLAFNVGIELGHLFFIGVVLSLSPLTRWLRATAPAGAARIPVYAMGALSSFWLLERVAALLYRGPS